MKRILRFMSVVVRLKMQRWFMLWLFGALIATRIIEEYDVKLALWFGDVFVWTAMAMVLTSALCSVILNKMNKNGNI